jgi:hypothetical protein
VPLAAASVTAVRQRSWNRSPVGPASATAGSQTRLRPRPVAHLARHPLVTLGHAAGNEVAAGRMTVDEATSAVRRSVLNLFGAEEERPGPA